MYISLFNFMRAITRAHANTLATSMMRVKLARATSDYWVGHWNKEN